MLLIAALKPALLTTKIFVINVALKLLATVLTAKHRLRDNIISSEDGQITINHFIVKNAVHHSRGQKLKYKLLKI